MSSDHVSPTMADIARELGVHASTVSRALRHDSRIRPEIRLRVEQTAERLGYRPNPSASALSETRWRGRSRQTQVNFGFLSPAPSDQALAASAFYLQYQPHAEKRGYHLIPLAINDSVTPRMINRRLREQSIRGVLLCKILYQQSLLSRFAWEELRWDAACWVSVREGDYSPPVARVLFNIFRATVHCLERMVQAGYRHILVVSPGSAEVQTARRQIAAALLVAQENPQVIIRTFHQANESLEQALKVSAADGFLAIGVWWGTRLMSAGQFRGWAALSLPKEQLGQIAGMPLPEEEMNQAAIDLLDVQCRTGSYGFPPNRKTLFVDSEWIEGPSLPHLAPNAQTAEPI